MKHGYDINSESKSSQWNCHKSKVETHSTSWIEYEDFLTIFFNFDGEVYHEFLLYGHKVNMEYKENK